MSGTAYAQALINPQVAPDPFADMRRRMLAQQLAQPQQPLYMGDVGTEHVGGDTALTMPSADVSPVVGNLGGFPVTAAANADAYRLAGNMLAFGPADVGAIKAFHASPYSFGGFDPTKIGTGEGAQAYGHGFYFAGNPATKDIYLRQFEAHPAIAAARDEWSNRIADLNSRMEPIGSAIDDAMRKGDDATVRALQQQYRPLHDEWMALNKNAPKPVSYEVALHAEPEHFLDWDKPLSEQSQHVQDALQKTGVPIDPSKLGADVVFGTPNPQHVSDALHWAGIPGIRYLDAGSRQPRILFNGQPIPGDNPAARLAAEKLDLYGDQDKAIASLAKDATTGHPYIQGMSSDALDLLRSGAVRRHAGQGTSNYVVFSPETIEILRRYGIAGLLGGTAAAGAATGASDQ